MTSLFQAAGPYMPTQEEYEAALYSLPEVAPSKSEEATTGTKRVAPEPLPPKTGL